MLTYMYINVVIVEISLYQHYDVNISYISTLFIVDIFVYQQIEINDVDVYVYQHCDC